MNTEDPLAPYKLDILLSTLYVGPAPTDLLLTAITKDGNIVEFRFSDRRALKCFLVYLFVCVNGCVWVDVVMVVV